MINEQLSKEQINKRVLDVLKLVGLEQLADSKPLKLSGGQRQRVGIARALVTDVNVLLCDEATSSLDPFTASEIINLLADLNSKLGITIVFVSHQLEIVRNFCDRIAIIDGGVVCECDDTINIFSKPKAEITWKLLKSILGLDNLVNIAQAGVITCHGETETKQLITKLYEREIEIHAINQHHTKQGKFTHLFVDIDSQTDESIRRVYEC